MLDPASLLTEVRLFLAAIGSDGLVRASRFEELESAYLAQTHTTDLSKAVCAVLTTATPFGSPYQLDSLYVSRLQEAADAFVAPTADNICPLDNICAACGKLFSLHTWLSNICPVGDTTYVPSTRPMLTPSTP